jgi:hypothetical protein
MTCSFSTANLTRATSNKNELVQLVQLLRYSVRPNSSSKKLNQFIFFACHLFHFCVTLKLCYEKAFDFLQNK